MSLKITAAEALAKNLGPRAGLATFRGLLGSAFVPAERARILEGALGCAEELRDEESLGWALWQWSDLGTGPFAPRAERLVRRWAQTAPQVARRLLDAELRRSPAARTYYLRGRLASDARSSRAFYFSAYELEPTTQIGLASRIRLARAGVPTAVDRVADEDLATFSESDQLVVLQRRLQSAKRYTRVAALDALDVMTRSRDLAVRRASFALAARHADGDPLPIEQDRLHAIFRTHPKRREVRTALRLRAVANGRVVLEPKDPEQVARPLQRAQMVLNRGNAGPAPKPPNAEWRALVAIAALQRGDDASEDFRTLLDTLSHTSSQRVTEPLLAAAYLGRRQPGAGGQRVARAAEQMAAMLVSRRPFARRGFLRLADAVADAQVSRRLREMALDANEAGAAERHGLSARKEAWAAMRAGETARARECIDRARDILRGLKPVKHAASSGPYRG